jgi:hypothetical protein
MGDYLMLFASAVTWHYFDLKTKSWTYGGELYKANKLSVPPSRPTDGRFWAPHVAPCPWSLGDLVIYHSDVTFEDNHESKISFALSSGDPPNLIWTAGDSYVVESRGYQMPFAIDPSVFEDDDGSFWLIYGSHAKGIVIVELNPATGYLKVDPENKIWSSNDPRFTTIANYGGKLDENISGLDAPIRSPGLTWTGMALIWPPGVGRYSSMLMVIFCAMSVMLDPDMLEFTFIQMGKNIFPIISMMPNPGMIPVH